MAPQKGSFYPHKDECTCFRCSGMAWNKGIKTGIKPWLGKKRSEEDKKKISNGRKGKMIGADHWEWKADKVGYRALHEWVERTLGKANHCSFNSSHKSTRFQWANISGQYLRDIDDWAQLCPVCHKTYDKIVKKHLINQFSRRNGQYSERNLLFD